MKHLLAIIFLLLPLSAFAHATEGTPGTDEYLRNVLGWSNERLTTAVATEDREAFDVAVGETSVDDPLGDVLDRNGTESKIHDPWGDIERVTLIKNKVKKTWDFQVTLGANLPSAIVGKAAMYVYADADGKAENNSPDPGVKLGMDSEFGLLYNAKGWHTGFRWFNSDPKANIWATDKTTKSTFKVSKNVISFSIPFAEMSGDITPEWRVVMALEHSGATEVDVAPTDGFPAAKPAPTPTPQYTPSSSPVGEAILKWFVETDKILLGAVVIVAGYLVWLIWSAKKK